MAETSRPVCPNGRSSMDGPSSSMAGPPYPILTPTSVSEIAPQLGRQAVTPPSMGMIAPVMYEERSEARKEASSATSSGWPPRFSAEPPTRAGKRSAAPLPPDIGVSMKPGQMALARMPCSPYSTAAALVTAMTPALAIEYALVGIRDPFMPPMDDQFTMAPPPESTMDLMPCLVPSITPRRLIDITRSYSSRSRSASSLAWPMPATLSTASTRPKASRAAANMASTSASLATSTWKGTTDSPSSLAVSSCAPLMSAARTLAPSRTNTSAAAFAIPEPAPVMTATLPSSSPMTLSLLSDPPAWQREGQICVGGDARCGGDRRRDGIDGGHRGHDVADHHELLHRRGLEVGRR